MTRKPILVLALAIVASACSSTPASLVNVDSAGLALQGYDPVAFFTEGKPVPGTAQYTATHEGATYRFSSDANRREFEGNPAAYAPAYGGYCGYGVGAANKLFPVEIDTWQIVDGRLILNLNGEIRQKFDTDRENLIRQADKNWAAMAKPRKR